MAKRLNITKTKNSKNFYIIDDYTDPQTKKRSTSIVERLGNLNSLKEKYNTESEDEIVNILKEYVNELKAKDKEEKSLISINFDPSKLIEKDMNRFYNIGYLYPRNILSSLGIKEICDEIKESRKFEYDLNAIIQDLISTRIIYPGSKRSSYKDAHNFLKVPEYQLEDVYRSLKVLADNRYEIEKKLYDNLNDIYKRDNSVLYYDCTNFYFEVEDENDFIKYGKSKENRPNPIVQYGLFMDANGIPLADIVFEGNKNEQFSLRELEDKITKDFNYSKFIVCADAGLNGWENKVYNDRKKDGAYIVTQPIKKLNKKMKEWVIDSTGWKILNHKGTYDISKLKDTIVLNGKTYNTKDITFYKSKWEKTAKASSIAGKSYTLEEQYIVSFSLKYKAYQENIRNKKLERARKLISTPFKLSSTNPRDPKYYITSSSITSNGEVCDTVINQIDEEKIREERKYDGFYCVTTDLEDSNIPLIIEHNKQRWEIEESFRIMKSELKTRPMYVTHEESIKGHLLICFIALMVYRILEKKYLNEEYTCTEIIEHLRELNILHLGNHNYLPSFKRIDLTDKLSEIFGFQPSKQILTQIYLNKFIKVVNSRKVTKLK